MKHSSMVTLARLYPESLEWKRVDDAFDTSFSANPKIPNCV